MFIYEITFIKVHGKKTTFNLMLWKDKRYQGPRKYFDKSSGFHLFISAYHLDGLKIFMYYLTK